MTDGQIWALSCRQWTSLEMEKNDVVDLCYKMINTWDVDNGSGVECVQRPAFIQDGVKFLKVA